MEDVASLREPQGRILLAATVKPKSEANPTTVEGPVTPLLATDSTALGVVRAGMVDLPLSG